MRTLVLAFLLLLQLGQAFALKSPAAVAPGVLLDSTPVELQLFLSTSCPHCQKADQYFHEVQGRYPWLRVKRFYVNRDEQALEYFATRLKAQDSDNFSLPAMLFCNTHWIGFADAKTSGERLIAALDYCRKARHADGTLSAGDLEVLKQQALASQLVVETAPSSLPVFILTTAWLDAMNYCSLFGLLSLFALLSLSWPRAGAARAVAIAFAVGIFLTHGLSSLYPDYFYAFISQSKIPHVLAAVGLVLYLYAALRKKNCHPAWLAALAFALAVALQISLQSCGINLALAFELWLNKQELAPLLLWGARLAYELAYLLPLFALGLVYCIVLRRFGPELLLGLVSVLRCYLLLLAVVLAWDPSYLQAFWPSALLALGGVCYSYYLSRLPKGE